MAEEKRTLWGDGRLSAVVTPETVVFSEVVKEDERQVLHVISMSHAEFREVVLGWQRHESEEQGQ